MPSLQPSEAVLDTEGCSLGYIPTFLTIVMPELRPHQFSKPGALSSDRHKFSRPHHLWRVILSTPAKGSVWYDLEQDRGIDILLVF